MLTDLNVSSNQLSSLPVQIGLLHVAELNLSNNNITSIPLELCQCPKLKVLVLDHNQLPLSEIRPQLFTNSKIINIQLSGNLFEIRSLRNVEGYDNYMQRCTDIKKKF